MRGWTAALAVALALSTACSSSTGGGAGATTGAGAGPPGTTEGAPGGERTSSGGEAARGPVESGAAVVPIAQGETWTFLVYMVADNDLEAFGLVDLHEMMGVGSGGGLEILVQTDRAEVDYEAAYERRFGRSPRGELGAWTQTKRLRVMEGEVEELADLGEVDMGDPQTLADFIAWGVDAAPADRVALIFWNHGAGWPGFGGDESTADHDLLTLAELAEGVDAGLSSAGLSGLSLVGFDACLMATYEVAVAMRPFAEILLASEELEPGHGWDYGALGAARQDPSMDGASLANALLQGFVAHAADEQTGQDITLSVTDLVALDALEEAFNGMAQSLAALAPFNGPALGKARATVQEYGSVPQDPSSSSHTVDVGHLAALVAAEAPELGAARDAVQGALADVVLVEHAGPKSKHSTGLSIYFPPKSSLYNAGYDTVPAVATWRSFLDAYYTAGSQVGAAPAFAVTENLGELTTDQGDLVLAAALTPGSGSSIVEAVTFVAIVAQEEDTAYFLGELPAVWDDTEAEGRWNGEALTVEQGDLRAYGYAAIAYDDDGSLEIDVPFAYVPPGGDAELAVMETVLDADGELLSQIFYLYADDVVAQLSPLLGSELFPVVDALDLNTGEAGWVITSDDGFDPFAPIELGTESLEPGTTIYMELDVYDFAGNGDYAYGTMVLGDSTTEPDPSPEPEPTPEPTPEAEGCGGIDEVGTCEGTLLLWCEADELVGYDCVDEGCAACGYDDFEGYYLCYECD